jgi:hypothetical protein
MQAEKEQTHSLTDSPAVESQDTPNDEAIDIASLLTGEPFHSASDPKPVVSMADLDEEPEKYEHTGYRNPHIKLWGTLGVFSLVVIAVFNALMGSCEDPATKAAKNPASQREAQLQQENAGLKKIVGDYVAREERAAQKRQQDEYLKALQEKGKKPAKPKGAKAVAELKALQREVAARRVSARNVEAPAPRAYRTFAAAPSIRTATPTPVARPVVRDNPENDAKMVALAQQLAAIREELAAAKEEKIAQPPKPEVETVAMEPEVQPVDGGYEEAALMSGQVPVMIGAGAEAEAILNTPIATQSSQVLMTLKEDIKGNDGEVAIPAGSQLQGEAQMSGPLVNIAVRSAVVNGQQMQIPPEFANAIAVMKGNNEPLVLKKMGGGDQFGKALLGGIISAGSGFASQLLTPQTTTTISSNGFIEQTSTSRPNSIGNAALSAGNQFGQSIAGSLNQQLAQNTNSSATIMALKAGTRVRLLFARDVPLVTASSAVSETSMPLEEVPTQAPMDLPESTPEGIPTPDELNEPLIPEDSGQFIEPDTENLSPNMG